MPIGVMGMYLLSSMEQLMACFSSRMTSLFMLVLLMSSWLAPATCCHAAQWVLPLYNPLKISWHCIEWLRCLDAVLTLPTLMMLASSPGAGMRETLGGELRQTPAGGGGRGKGACCRMLDSMMPCLHAALFQSDWSWWRRIDRPPFIFAVRGSCSGGSCFVNCAGLGKGVAIAILSVCGKVA
jgi:hypothetical protein